MVVQPAVTFKVVRVFLEVGTRIGSLSRTVLLMRHQNRTVHFAAQTSKEFTTNGFALFPP